MTDDEQYEEGRREIEHVFGERKAINRKFLLTCERKIDSTPTSESPTKWIIGKLAFQEFEDVWDNFERLALFVNNSVQNLEHRLKSIEDSAIKLGIEIKPEEIASAAKFAEEFHNHIEDLKKERVEYRRKMEENDLAT